MKKFVHLSLPVLMFTPVVVAAQNVDGVQNLIAKINAIVGGLIPTLIGIAVLLFIWGVLKFVFAKSDTDKDAARSFMIWGIVALFVMVSVWGIVRILGDVVFGTQGSQGAPERLPWPASPTGN
jgi:amino acid permease